MCGSKQQVCGYDTNQNEKYCYAKTLVSLVTQQPVAIPQKTLTTQTVIPGCSPPCTCRKPQDAAATGYIACGGTTIPCGYDQSQNPMYCYKPLVSQTTIPVTPLIPVLPSPKATPVQLVTAMTPVLPSPKATPVQLVAAVTPVPVVALCSDSIRGRIDNLTVNPATVGIELCRAIEVTPGSGTGTGSSGTMSASSRFIVGNGLGNRLAAFGISTPVNQLNEEMFRHIEQGLPQSELRWLCDPSSSPAYTTLSSHATFEFSRLCPGIYKVSPFYRPSGDECRWTGTFWDETLTKGGPRIVNSSNASEASDVRFVFRPLDTTRPEITFRFDPEYPSMRDGFRIIAEASDESGIAKISMNGVVVKNMRARTHCRIERVETDHGVPDERRVCDWEEYGISEPFERNCTSSDECSVDIAPEPRATDNSQGEGITGYTITVNATACDRAGMKQSAGKYYQRLPVPRPPLEFAPHSYEVWVNESLRPNAWNETMYRDQEVYLIPDTDWHAVLEVMSVTQWPDTESAGRSRYDRNYPLIIYHQEPDGTFDIDAAVDFIRQYRAQHVTVFFPHRINYDPLFDDAIRAHIANSGIVETWDTYPPRHDPVTIGWYDDDPNATVRLIDFDPENPSTLYDRFYSVQNRIMVVPDDYPTALDASVLSGFYHRPLYFSDHIRTQDLEHRNVTAIRLPWDVLYPIRDSAASVNDGKNDPAVLQADYRALSDGKTILVNPKDIDESLRLPGIDFSPDINTGSPITAYGRMSLAAPYLAIARRERILQYPENPFMLPDDTCSSPNHEALIAWKTRAVSDISPRMSGGGSLTILADPRYIPDSYYRGCEDGSQVRTQVDREYNPSGAVGRIYGPTVTDASAYVARSLSISFSSLVQPITGGYTGSDYNIASLLIAHSIGEYEDSAERIYDWGYNTHMECHIGRGYRWCERNISPPADAYSDRRIILFLDHGDQYGWYNTIRGWNLPRALGMSVVFGDACSTNNFWSGGQYTMGPWWIRKGAIAYYGAVGVSQYYYCDGFGHETSKAERFMDFWWGVRSGTSLGGLNDAMDSCTEHCWTDVTDCSTQDDLLLLGDPLYRLTPLVDRDRYPPEPGEADCGYC